MQKKLLKFLALGFILLSSVWLQGVEERKLNYGDIKPIMEQILSYHVDQKMLSPETVQRSFKTYLTSFDPEKSYFLKEEATPFLEPSKKIVQSTIDDYNHGQFTQYEHINELIQNAILRNREIRMQLFADAIKVFSDSEFVEVRKNAEEVDFASSLDELKDRILQQGLRFVRAQAIKTDRSLTKDEKEKVLNLYLKKLENAEDLYLFANFAKEDHEHLLSLRILKSLAKSLDSHTAFFSEAEAYNMRINLEKGFQGIGVVLEETFDGVKINRVIKGGPADNSKLIKEDDYIVSVQGQDISKLPFSEILDLIRGEKDTEIKLGLKRLIKGEGPTKERFLSVSLKRGKVTLDDQRVETSFETFGDGILATIVLHSFYEGDDGISSEHDMINALEELKKEGDIKGLVLDLRENSGGFLSQAVKVAGLFISNGVVVISKYSENDQRVFRDLDGKTYYDGPLTILTSKLSASAAEIVSQTLQDYGRGLVVGSSTTYGKGSIQHQTITNAEADAHFKVTVGRYYTVSGKSTQINGVIADIVVPGKLSHEKIGERYLDFPLAYDAIDSKFNDSLMDLDLEARKWFQRYYTPSLQQVDNTWKELLPTIRKNSNFRIQHNTEYQQILAQLDEDVNLFAKDESTRLKDAVEELEELQEKEAYNILKDMILLQSNKTAFHAQ